MKRKLATLFWILPLLLAASGAPAAPQKDATGCKDHSLFTRMPGYWIHSCKQSQFDSYSFKVAKNNRSAVEGQFWHISYYPNNDLDPRPSELQILRNFQNAVEQAGGTLVFTDRGISTFKLAKEGKEFWIEATAEFTGKHGLRIVQVAGMKQDIVANAEVFQSDIRAKGHATVYGILFDTDKADIKPESAQAIGEIAKLLKADAKLKIAVVGHTDGTGSVDHNLRLSQGRAQAVMQALTRDHGIAASRLTYFGCGPFAPVASNDSEDGKAKNRRVELVKQ
jgi:outer membrane protein OmpA-like peptidoglycan-associated protein